MLSVQLRLSAVFIQIYDDDDDARNVKRKMGIAT